MKNVLHDFKTGQALRIDHWEKNMKVFKIVDGHDKVLVFGEVFRLPPPP